MEFTAPDLATALFDLVPCAVVVIDRDYYIVTANTAFREAYGDWEGRHCYEIFKRRHRPCRHCVASLTFRDGRVHVTEEQGVDKDGRPTFHEVKTAPLYEASEVTHVLEMSLDITRYRALDQQHQLLFERVPCFVTVLDRNFRIVEANYRHQETFGDSKGLFCHRVYLRSDEPCTSCPVRRTLQDGQVHTEQKEALDKKGNKIHFLVHSAPIHDHDGDIVRVIEMATDITPMIQMQEKLLQAEGDAAMKQAVAMLSTTASQLLAGFEHGVSMLRSGLDGGDTSTVRRASDWLRSRVEHLISMNAVMSRYRSGGAAVAEQMDAKELLEPVLRRFSAEATSSGTEVRADVEQGLTIRGVDPGAIQDCLACLIHSFSDMCIPGPQAAGSYHVLLKAHGRPGGGVLLEVAQRGLDLADKRPDAETVEDHGVSMGLVVVQRTIEAQGGRVSFTSPHGHGITFQIELP